MEHLDVWSILISALLGGMVAGIGGLIAYRLGKRLPVKPQVVSTICGLAGFVIAYAVVPVVKNGVVGAPSNDNATASVTRIDQQFRADSMLLRLVAEEWPAEYQAFLKDMAKQTDQAVANRLGNEFTTTLRKSNAELAVYSPDAGLREYFLKYQNFLSDISVRDGDALCAAVLNQGPAALGNRASGYLAHLDDLGVSTMKLLLDGRGRREQGSQATPDVSQADMDAFDAFLIDRTGEQGLVLKLQTGTDKDLCSAGIRVMRALSEFAPDQPSGQALRSATLYNIASA